MNTQDEDAVMMELAKQAWDDPYFADIREQMIQAALEERRIAREKENYPDKDS